MNGKQEVRTLFIGREQKPSNNALDPTAVSVSILMFTGFMASLSFLDRAVPAVGQLGRYLR